MNKAALSLRVHRPLRDGTPVCIRAIRPDDKELLQSAFEKLSSVSVHRRFLHSMKALTAEQLRQLTEVDFRDHVAFVMSIEDRGAERIIAVGRFVRDVSDGTQADLAVTVADDYQHRGAGTLLLEQLVEMARSIGIRELVADVLADNRDMIDLIINSGLPLRSETGDGVWRGVLRLDGGA